MFNRRLSTEVDSAARVDVAALVSIVKFSFADAAVDVIQRTNVDCDCKAGWERGRSVVSCVNFVKYVGRRS